MKTQSSKKSDASTMIATAILAVFVAGFLGTYLLIVSNEYRAVARSQTWNSAISMAESGAEDALALINKTKDTSITDWVLSAKADGWDTNNQTTYQHLQWGSYTSAGTNNHWNSTSGLIYHVRRFVDPALGYYDVYINNSNTTTNEILCVGTATNGPLSLTRKIYLKAVTISQAGADGLVANVLTFNGNNVTIDSFDSSTSAHSIWHTNLFFHGANYGTWTNTLSYNSNTIPSRTANVHVAAETNYIDVGNANIYGYINTMPGGTQNVGNQGSVGDLDWVHSNHNGLQPGHFRDDLNSTWSSKVFPIHFTNSIQTDVFLPLATGANGVTNVIRIGCIYSNGILVNNGLLYTNKNNNGWSLPDGNGGLATYDYVITNQPAATNNIYYARDTLNIPIFVDAPYSVLYASNGMSSPTITINTNCDLTIYTGGDVTFGTTVNNTALARALTINDILGKPIEITASGNASGVSKIFAPSSTVKFNGGGNNTYDIIGEIVCRSATFNGHFNLHFDESLKTASPAQQFTVVSWKEVQ